MTVRTQVLASASSSPAGSLHTRYTCPAGRTALLKDLRVYSDAGCTRAVVFMSRSGAADVSLFDQSLAATGIAGTECFVALEPGDELVVFSSGGTFELWASGAELDGVAP